MSWFSRRRKDSEPTPAQPKTNRPEELANRLQRERRIDQLEPELLKFDLRELHEAELESWHHLFGITAFQRGDHAQALERFQQGHSEFPNFGDIGFSLGQEYEHIGQADKAFELFDQFKFPKVRPTYALTQARYAYLWNRFEQALSYVEPLMPAYYSLGIADDHFLFMRGFPFFSETSAYLGLFYTLLNRRNEFVSFTHEAASKLSDYDFEGLHLEAQCLLTDNMTPLVTKLEKQISEWKANKWPTAYSEMRLAVLRASDVTDRSNAEQMIGAVQIGPNDFQWLNDIRLLAQCELAHRFGDVEREELLVAQFLKKQPLLFEPSHSLNFGLWPYQEGLKARYQLTKQQNAN